MTVISAPKLLKSQPFSATYRTDAQSGANQDANCALKSAAWAAWFPLAEGEGINHSVLRYSIRARLAAASISVP